MSTVDKDLLYEQLENLKVLRHDFLNYFQVIRGYLQLNMPDKALEYIDEILISLLPQQDIYKIAEKTVLAVLLSFYFKLHKNGVEMTIKYPEEMKNKDYWLPRWKEEYAELLYGYTMECSESIPLIENPENLFVEVNLNTRENGFAFGFILYYEQKKITQKTYVISENVK